MNTVSGEEVHGQLTSTDAHLTVAVPFFTQGGRSRTILAKEVVMITDITVVAAAGGALTLEATDGTTHLYLYKGTVAAFGGVSKNLTTPFAVPRGYTLKLTAPAGQVDVQVEGFVTN